MSSDPLAEIYHYLPLLPTLATAGQPTAEQLAVIQAAGYELVINLALPTSTRALADEPELIQKLGMDYVAIPVAWETPALDDLDRFLAVMEQNSDRKIFVHCAANMRVSAFVYVYRLLKTDCDRKQALADLHQIWTPNPVWQNLIDQALAQKGIQSVIES